MWNRIPNSHTNSSERFFHFFLVLEKSTGKHSSVDNRVYNDVWYWFSQTYGENVLELS